MLHHKAQSRLFAALGDETRLRLVARLCADGPASIKRLTARSKITRQAITKHLRVMEKSGLVRCTHQGREAIWQLEQPGIDHARRYLDAVSARWDDALLRLRTFVEGDADS